MAVITDPAQIDHVLTRGVAEGIGLERLRERMLAGEQLRIKLGIDPTSPNLHIGRAVTLLKLRDFQKLGHKVIVIVGNATGVIGDTSDKEAERPMLTAADIAENMESYKQQIATIIDIENPELFELTYNADWLNTLGYAEIGEHADVFSVHEFIARDNIKRRLDAGKRVSLREMLYPLMQGYDSVHLRADVELGGNDQRFNLLAGRALQERYGQEPQAVIMNEIIVGTDGRKMSSSWGNVIALRDDARTMTDKIMNIADDLVAVYFENCTRLSKERIDAIMTKDDMRLVKADLVDAIVSMYHEDGLGTKEKLHAIDRYVNHHVDDANEVLLTEDVNIVDALVAAGAATSKGDARRKIEQGGVSIDGTHVDVTRMLERADAGMILKVGKKFYRTITFEA